MAVGRPRSTTPCTPRPSMFVKSSTAGSAPSRSRAASAMARAMGCSEASSMAPASRRTSSAVLGRRGDHVLSSVICPVVTVPVLSSTMVSIRAGGLQDLGALDQDAQLGAAAGADHEGGGRGEPERAGAGDDEDGDGRGERCGQPAAGADPEAERGRCQRDDDRHEDAGDPVGEPLDLRLAVLRVLDETRHLRQLGVGPDAGGADHQPPAGVHGGADDRVARADLDRHRLTGEHRRVDGGAALLDHPVGGDLLARA